MAKINRFILKYTDIITAADIPVGDGLPPKAAILCQPAYYTSKMCYGKKYLS